MGQNTSSAVMAQRVEAPDSLDYFPTPPWATRALCEWLGRWCRPHVLHAWDPACGEGHMVRPLREYFARVSASDVHDYGVEQERVGDYLIRWDRPPHIESRSVDWVITNPPFRLACEFALTAQSEARGGVALLVRTAWLEGGVAGASRHARLFRPHPPAAVLQFCDRVPMCKGRLDENLSTATAYCWVVWNKALPGSLTTFEWIAPCRRALERPGDYGEPPVAGLAGAPLLDGAA